MGIIDSTRAAILDYFNHTTWLIQILLILALTLLAHYLLRKLLTKLAIQLARTPTYWDDALVIAAQKPSIFLLWVTGLAYIIKIIQQYYPMVLFEAVNAVYKVVVIMMVSWFLASFIRQGEQNILTKRQEKDAPFDKTTADAITKLLQISIFTIAVLMSLQTLGYNIAGLLAFGGIGGLAIGFAARDLLANFFGGIMIYLDRPFDVGDWIRSPDREIEGTVEKIGWRLTQICTFEKRPLYLPNSIFTSIAIENPSRMSNRRIKESMGIRYSDATKMHSIINDIKTMLRQHEEIDTQQTMIVNFDECAPSSLNFFIYTFTKTTDWIKFHEIKQDVMLKVIDIIEANGAECAFPTSTIHIPEGIPASNVS